MNVTPVELAVKPGFIPPQQPMTASLPPVHLRKSADRLLKNMLRRGLIKKADRHTGPVSRAFFKAKRNGEARLLVDYKSSQVNEMLLKPFHPQFGVRLNAKKFQFGKQIRFGGLILNKLGAVPDEHRMDCVKRYPRPTTKKQVTQFLGVATSLANSFTI